MDRRKRTAEQDELKPGGSDQRSAVSPPRKPIRPRKTRLTRSCVEAMWNKTRQFIRSDIFAFGFDFHFEPLSLGQN